MPRRICCLRSASAPHLPLLVVALLSMAGRSLQAIKTEATHRWVETLSWEPRAFLHHSFLTEEECDHLIELARPSIARSSVVDADTGSSKLDDIRTSYGTFLKKGQDDVVAEIEERIAFWTKIPAANGEDIQVLRYENGQEYGAHWDWFDDENKHAKKISGAGNRLATVLMYLSDVDEGGETAFPHGIWSNEKLQKHGTYSECGDAGVAARPNKGDALLFWNLEPSSTEGDKYSLHAGCPVIKGTKWSATKWIHVRDFGAKPINVDPSCKDEHPNCEEWAELGECDNNPAYMLKGCRKSCEVCTPKE